MTDNQIIKKAIEKAEKCEFNYNEPKYLSDELGVMDAYERIIFSHDFAKAFWGEEIVCGYCGNQHEDYQCLYLKEDERCSIQEWQYHLQQIVLEKEPLKYLEKFL